MTDKPEETPEPNSGNDDDVKVTVSPEEPSGTVTPEKSDTPPEPTPPAPPTEPEPPPPPPPQNVGERRRIVVRGRTIILDPPSLGTSLAILFFAMLALENKRVDQLLRDSGTTLDFPTVEGSSFRFPQDIPVREASLVPWIIAAVSVLVAGTSFVMMWASR